MNDMKYEPTVDEIEFMREKTGDGIETCKRRIKKEKLKNGVLLIQDHEVKVQPRQNTQKKIGRNDPCPCESGKKFKKCCLGKGVYD